jgi:hypothetical protein
VGQGYNTKVQIGEPLPVVFRETLNEVCLGVLGIHENDRPVENPILVQLNASTRGVKRVKVIQQGRVDAG